MTPNWQSAPRTIGSTRGQWLTLRHARRSPGGPVHPELDSLRVFGPHHRMRPDCGAGRPDGPLTIGQWLNLKIDKTRLSRAGATVTGTRRLARCAIGCNLLAAF